MGSYDSLAAAFKWMHAKKIKESKQFILKSDT